jgi:hypothetical protein
MLKQSFIPETHKINHFESLQIITNYCEYKLSLHDKEIDKIIGKHITFGLKAYETYEKDMYQTLDYNDFGFFSQHLSAMSYVYFKEK